MSWGCAATSAAAPRCSDSPFVLGTSNNDAKALNGIQRSLALRCLAAPAECRPMWRHTPIGKARRTPGDALGRGGEIWHAAEDLRGQFHNGGCTHAQEMSVKASLVDTFLDRIRTWERAHEGQEGSGDLKDHLRGLTVRFAGCDHARQLGDVPRPKPRGPVWRRGEVSISQSNNVSPGIGVPSNRDACGTSACARCNARGSCHCGGEKSPESCRTFIRASRIWVSSGFFLRTGSRRAKASSNSPQEVLSMA